MPAGAVGVARPSGWGNPYRIGVDGPFQPARDRAHAVEMFAAMVEASPVFQTTARRELAGRDLACWCPLDGPCHADVLLAVANSQEPLATRTFEDIFDDHS